MSVDWRDYIKVDVLRVQHERVKALAAARGMFVYEIYEEVVEAGLDAVEKK